MDYFRIARQVSDQIPHPNNSSEFKSLDQKQNMYGLYPHYCAWMRLALASAALGESTHKRGGGDVHKAVPAQKSLPRSQAGAFAPQIDS